jgi:hypothetical protein
MTTMNKDYCVKKAFSDIQRAAGYKRQCASSSSSSSSCNCSYCQEKRLAASRLPRERLEAVDRQAKENRRIREQRESEYQKTVRLLRLIKGSMKDNEEEEKEKKERPYFNIN